MPSSTSSSDRGPGSLLLRGMAFGLLLLGSLVIVGIGAGPGARVDYYQALSAKHARLEGLGSPKLVLMGGSSAAFGFDSEALGKALCMPVANMTLHASLGLNFMTNEIGGSLGRGDVVLLSMEPGMFNGPTGDLELGMALDADPASWRHVPPQALPKSMAVALVMRLKGAFRATTRRGTTRQPDPFFRKDSFDGNGDLRLTTEALAADTLPLPVMERDSTMAPAVIEQLVKLRERVATAGATLLFAWPPIARSSADARSDQRVAAVVHGADIATIGPDAAPVFPDTAFLDTPLHLRPWGRAVRTEGFIEDLCRARPDLCCPLQ